MDASDFMPDAAATAAIREGLEQHEAGRRSARRQATWRIPVFLGGLAIAAYLLARGFNGLADPYEQWVSTPHVLLYVICAAAALALYWLAMRPVMTIRNRTRARLLPVIFGFVQDVRCSRGEAPDSFERLPREVTGGFNREAFDDVVTGTYAGFAFELYEASLRQTSATASLSAFKGVVVAFQSETPFPGLLIATRKTEHVVSFFSGLFEGRALDQMSSGAADVDAVYEFRTDNADAAGPIVTGRLAQALRWLGEAWPEEPARIALHGGDGFLLLPTAKNFFDLPDGSTRIDYDRHVKPIISDMASLLATASLVRRIGGESDNSDPA